MKRRKVLTSASVLAGAALTGCGGGGEDGALGADPSSQIGAYTIPRNLVPTNGTQYQVEVVFQSIKAVSVYLCNDLAGSKLIASKSVTTGDSHKIGFALLRCTSTVGYTNADFSLEVRETNGNTTQNYYAGDRDTTPDNSRQYLTHSDSATEYEWNFYSRVDGGLQVSVRFFPIPAAEHITFHSGEYVRVIFNTATHANGGGRTKLLPIHHYSILQMPNHECAVVHDATNNCDTLCLPNIRRQGHDELVPSYLAATAIEKPLLKRRLARHVDRFAKATRQNHLLNSRDDQAVHHLLGNELVRILGGKSLIDHLNEFRADVRTSVRDNLEQMGAAFHTFCANRLPALSSQAMIDQTRQLLEDEVDIGQGSSDMAGGCSVSTSLQLGASLTTSTPLFLGLTGGGLRVSLGLARASRRWIDKTLSALDTYNLTQHATKGTKVGATGIFKGFNGSLLSIKGVSFDVEITINMTILGGVHRVDLIQFDPVLDLDTRTWVGELVADGMARLLAAEAGGTQPIAVLTRMTHGVPPFAMGLGPEIGVFAGQLANSVAGFVSSGIKDHLNPLLKRVRDDLKNAGAPTRTWGTAEFSPLRFMCPNANTNDPDVPFSKEFNYGSWGWQPGVKYIAGFGIAPQYSVPYVEEDAPVPPGTVTFSGFARVVAVADVYASYGSTEYTRAVGFPWEM